MSIQWKSILHNSIIEILGVKQAAELFNLQFSPDPGVEELHSRLKGMLGYPTVLGVEQRIGQAGFRYFLTQMGNDLGLFSPALKLLPARQKTIKGFGILSNFFQKMNDELIELSETDTEYHVIIHSKLENHSSKYHGCHFLIGFIKEYMAWIGSGRVFMVAESECRSDGYKNCIYNIRKDPFD
jgi:hypothetical protein